MARVSTPPTKKGEASLGIKTPPPRSTGKSTPVFCFRHIQPKFDVKALPIDRQAQLAQALQERGRMTWDEITLAPRHGLGSELLPRRQIKAPIPAGFEDQERFLVLRYAGKLPMVGTRTNDTFHILWIESEFGELYDHG